MSAHTTAVSTLLAQTFARWSDVAHSSPPPCACDRVLVDATDHEQPVQWLLAPLAAGASIVLCANLDRRVLDGRIAAEGVTRML